MRKKYWIIVSNYLAIIPIMKHYLLKKPAAREAKLPEFYLWDILAQGVLHRLKGIKLPGKTVAIIGPGSKVLVDYLQQMNADMYIDLFATSWELTNQHYDLIIINGVLAWFNAPAALIEDSYAALNPNGLLLLSTLGPETLVSAQQAAVKMGWQPRVDALVDMHHWGDCLLQTGFLDPVMDRQDIRIRFQTPQDWFSDWQQQGLQDPSEPACHHLVTSKQWQQFLHICHQDKSQPWEARFECLFGHAYKPAIPKQKATEEGVVVSLESLRKTLPSQS